MVFFSYAFSSLFLFWHPRDSCRTAPRATALPHGTCRGGVADRWFPSSEPAKVPGHGDLSPRPRSDPRRGVCSQSFPISRIPTPSSCGPAQQQRLFYCFSLAWHGLKLPRLGVAPDRKASRCQAAQRVCGRPPQGRGRGVAERKELLLEGITWRRETLVCPSPPSFSAPAGHEPETQLMRLSMGEGSWAPPSGQFPGGEGDHRARRGKEPPSEAAAVWASCRASGNADCCPVRPRVSVQSLCESLLTTRHHAAPGRSVRGRL